MDISVKKEKALSYIKAASLFSYKDGKVSRKTHVNGGAQAGEILCSKGRKTYHTVMVDGEAYKLHRIVWLLNYKEWPNGQIGHINGDRMDNLIANLRVVSNRQNCKNQSIAKNNSSGHVGVSWAVCCSKWMSNITNNGKRIYLGVFSDMDDAIKARKEAEIKYNFHPNHGRAV